MSWPRSLDFAGFSKAVLTPRGSSYHRTRLPGKNTAPPEIIHHYYNGPTSVRAHVCVEQNTFNVILRIILLLTPASVSRQLFCAVWMRELGVQTQITATYQQREGTWECFWKFQDRHSTVVCTTRQKYTPSGAVQRPIHTCRMGRNSSTQSLPEQYGVRSMPSCRPCKEDGELLIIPVSGLVYKLRC